MAALIAAAALAGCGDDGASDGDEAPASSSGSASGPAAPSESLTESPTATPEPTLPAAKAQNVVNQIILDESATELSAASAANSGTGLQHPTFRYCPAADRGATGESLRVARAQQWWRNQEYASDSAGGVSVGNEVVYYSGDGLAQYLAALAAVPNTCGDENVLETGVNYAYAAKPVPAGLPAGAVSVRMTLTYPDGSERVGYTVVVPSGNVADILYVYGSDAAAADEHAARLLPALQRKLDTAEAAETAETTS